jgi:serine/threonine protein kinase
VNPDLDAVAAALPDYEVQREIGRGQFGLVWAGRHRHLARNVAIKQLVLPTELNIEGDEQADLSVHGVTAEDLETTSTLVNALIAQLARGLVIDDGMVLDIGGDVGTLRFTRRGHIDDPDFNNEHLEITRR